MSNKELKPCDGSGAVAASVDDWIECGICRGAGCSNAAQTPIAWMLQEPGQSKRWYTSGEAAMQHWVSKGAISTPLYAAPIASTTPQPTPQFEAWAKLHHYDLTRCSHEPYAAYRSDLTNAALAGWRGANGEASPQPDERAALANLETLTKLRTFLNAAGGEGFVLDGVDGGDLYMAIFDAGGNVSDRLFSDQVRVIAFNELFEFQEATGFDTAAEYRAAAQQPDHYQQLLGVAYVVLGCLVANGVDIPVRFLDAFSDPDSVENPLELLPCDFSPAQAVRAAVEAAALTDERILGEFTRRSVHVYDEDGEVKPLGNAVLQAVRAILAAPKEGS